MIALYAMGKKKELRGRLQVRYIIFILIILVHSLLRIPIKARAGDFGSAFKAAIASFPPSPSIAGMGGAWAAVPRTASDNPASISIFKKYKLKTILYADTSLIHFNQGRGVYSVNNGLLLSLVDGCLKISSTSIDADQFYNKKLPGSYYSLKSRDIKFSYGRKINNSLAWGIFVKPWGKTTLDLKSPGITLAKSRGRIKLNVRPGILFQPAKGCYLGLTYEYADTKNSTVSFNPFSLTKDKTTGHSFARIWRMGASWQPKTGTLLALDWQVGEVDSPARGDYDIDAFFFGIEQYLHKNLALRMGSLDGSITAGIRFSYRNLFLDYVYIKESLRDLNPYCGSSKSHVIALSVTF